MNLKKIMALVLTCALLISVFPLNTIAAEDNYLHDTIDQYADFDYSDPYDISDEDFFGVWDDAAGDWSKIPCFSYEDYPDMGEVESAAKAGDYERCKDELLAYYRRVLRTRPVTIGNSSSKANEMMAELYANNMFRISNLMQKVILQEDAQWYNVNVTSNVRGLLSKASKNLTIGAIALKKDGYMARIASKESDLTDSSGESVVPYILVNVNGEERKYYAKEDTYISADLNESESFGDEPWVKAEESTTTVESVLKWDGYTKKGYLAFSFDDIKNDDVINLAEFHFYGNYTLSDNPENTPDDITEKAIYLYAPGEEVWNEETFTWKTKSALAGVSFDKEAGPTNFEAGGDLSGNWKAEYTAGSWEQTLAQMYETSGNEAYAYHAIRLLVHNARIINNDYFIKNSGVFFVGNRLIRVVSALYCLIDSPHMTADAFTALMKNQYNYFEWLSGYWAAGFENSNLGVIPLTEGIEAGLAFQEYRPMFGTELEFVGTSPAHYVGDWLVTFFKRLSVIMNDYIQADGSSKDISLEYVIYVFNNILQLYDAMDRYGIDHEQYLPGLLDRMDMNAEFIVSKLTPKLTYWQNGDDSQYNAWVGPQKALQLYLNVRENPIARYVASGRKEGVEPPYDMSISDIMKFAIMRSSWNEDSVSMHINADGGTIHGHADDLHVSVFGYGQFLLVDPLNYSYNRTSLYNMWFETTTGHNAVEINDTNQKGYSTYSLPSYPNILGDIIKVDTGATNGVRGTLHEEDRENNDVYDYISAETFNYTNHSTLNGDFKNYRDVLFIKPGYFVVTDYMEPENNEINTYKQNWHFLPEANISLSENGNTVTNFDGTANIVVAPVNYGDGMVASIEDGFFGYTTNSGVISPAKGSRYTKRQPGITTYNTILYPVASGTSAEISTEPITLDVPNTVANAASATIIDSAKGTKQLSYYTLFDKNQKVARVFGTYETDGTLAFAETTDSNITTALVRNGSYLKRSDGKYLIMSEEPLTDLGVSYDYIDKIVSIGGAPDAEGNSVDIEKLTVYCDMDSVSEVIYEGNPINFKRSGSYLYFGDVPVINDGSSLPGEGTTEENKKPGHSLSGGGGSASSGSSDDDKKPEVQQPTQEPKPILYESEIKGHWGEEEIRTMVEKGVVEGNGDSLCLSDNITRAEFITLMLRALDKEVVSYDNCFDDVSNENWYADNIQTAYNLGWINGDGNGKALPDGKISREEMAKIIVSACGITDLDGTNLEITDKEYVSDWAEKYVSAVINLGLMQGAEEGKFYPRSSARREEAIVVLYRLMEKIN